MNVGLNIHTDSLARSLSLSREHFLSSSLSLSLSLSLFLSLSFSLSSYPKTTVFDAFLAWVRAETLSSPASGPIASVSLSDVSKSIWKPPPVVNSPRPSVSRPILTRKTSPAEAFWPTATSHLVNDNGPAGGDGQLS